MVTSGAEVGGGIRFGASQTDNVLLDTSPNQIDDVVFQASPYLSVVHESPTWDANVDYAFDWYRYSDLKASSRFHRGEVRLTGKALQDSLAAELGARRSQTLSNPDGPIPSGRLPLSGNLVDQDEWWINPRLNRTLGSTVTLNANYRYSRIQFDDSLVQDSTNNAGALSLENYKASRGLTWALRYDWRRAEYQFSPPWENQRASGELGFWANAKTRLFGASGKESSWKSPFDPSMEDSFWEAGIAHTAGENFSAEFAAGERSFGSSWRGRLDFNFRRGGTSLKYEESPTTTGFSPGGRTRTEFDPDGLNDFLDRPGGAERFVSSRFEWNLDLEFRRTGVRLALFDEERFDRIGADGTLLGDQSQAGVSASFSWQAGVRTKFAVTGSVVDQELDAGNKSELARARLDVTYRLGTRSDLSLAYSYTEQQPQGEDSIQASKGRDYVANVVSLFFTISM